MERTVEQHVMQYRCQARFSASHCQVLLGNPDEASLRQLIRGIVREELELQKAYLVCRQPSAASLSDVLREEIRQALQPTLVQPSIPATTYDVAAAQVMTTQTCRANLQMPSKLSASVCTQAAAIHQRCCVARSKTTFQESCHMAHV